MDESGQEKSGWLNKIKNKVMGREVTTRSTATITSQARPMTPEEVLTLADANGDQPKTRDVIRRESQARMEINKAKERKGRAIAAGVVGTAMLVGTVAAGVASQVNHDPTPQGQTDTTDKPTINPGLKKSAEAQRDYNNSLVPTEDRANAKPVPTIERPKQV